jgi:hypothetical protein
MGAGLKGVGIGWVVVEADVVDADVAVSGSDDTLGSINRLRRVCLGLANDD